MMNVVQQLRKEHQRAVGEVHRLEVALKALTGVGSFGHPKRVLSAEARERIAEAQRQRWAKTRKAAKQGK